MSAVGASFAPRRRQRHHVSRASGVWGKPLRLNGCLAYVRGRRPPSFPVKPAPFLERTGGFFGCRRTGVDARVVGAGDRAFVARVNVCIPRLRFFEDGP